MDSALIEDANAATVRWFVGALEHANTTGQTRLATYLEAVVEEVVFEVEADTRRGGHM